MAGQDCLDGLPETFDYTEARHLGVSGHKLSRLLAERQIEQVSRGLYRRANADELVDLGLIEVAHRVPDGTLCLVTALARWELTDQIPATIDVAIPRGRRPRRLVAPITWHHFARETFDVGRKKLDVGAGEELWIYSAERSIIDAFRLRHREGADLAIEALRTWLRLPGSNPAALIKMAGDFPLAVPSLRSALEVLL